MYTIFVHLATGFEEIEALTPIDVLRRAGQNVQTISIMESKLVKSSRGVEVMADLLFSEADYSKADLLVLPGGMPGSKNLDNHKELHQKLLSANQQGKWIAAICAAPMVLGHLGLLKGKTATCFPGMETELTGAHVTTNAVEISGKIITSRGAGTSLHFALSLVEILCGNEKAREIAKSMVVQSGPYV